MKEAPKQLVVFDIDGTLIDDVPDDATRRMFWKFVDNGFFHDLPDHILERAHDLRNRAHESDASQHEYNYGIFPIFDAHIQGKPVAHARRYAEEVAEDIVATVHPEVYEELELWRDMGAKLGIISGSPELIARPLARRLGVHVVAATRHYHNNHTYTVGRKTSPRAGEKHLIIDKWLTQLGEQAVLAAAYGDTVHDLSMLERAREPVAVAPKPALAQIAIERNWRIVTPQTTQLSRDSATLAV